MKIQELPAEVKIAYVLAGAQRVLDPLAFMERHAAWKLAKDALELAWKWLDEKPPIFMDMYEYVTPLLSVQKLAFEKSDTSKLHLSLTTVIDAFLYACWQVRIHQHEHHPDIFAQGDAVLAEVSEEYLQQSIDHRMDFFAAYQKFKVENAPSPENYLKSNGDYAKREEIWQEWAQEKLFEFMKKAEKDVHSLFEIEFWTAPKEDEEEYWMFGEK